MSGPVTTRFWMAVALLLVLVGMWIAVADDDSVDAVIDEDSVVVDDRAIMTDSALSSVGNAQSALANENYGLARRELESARDALETLVITRTSVAVGPRASLAKGQGRN